MKCRRIRYPVDIVGDEFADVLRRVNTHSFPRLCRARLRDESNCAGRRQEVASNAHARRIREVMVYQLNRVIDRLSRPSPSRLCSEIGIRCRLLIERACVYCVQLNVSFAVY